MNRRKEAVSPCSFLLFPKCTEGDNEQEALANAEEAIRAIVEYRRDNGIPIPADADPQVRRITLAA